MSYRVRPEAYGEAFAEVYDQMYPDHETPATLDFLASLVEPGARVLELGAGTGRLAVPLADRGLRVHAVDASERMLQRLRARDRNGAVVTVCGDFTDDVVDGEFDLCWVVCNTLFMVPDVEQQIAALRAAGTHLAPGGTLVVEVYDPTFFHQLAKPELQARHLAPDKVMLDTISVDPAEQILTEIHTVIGAGTVSTYVEVSRYAWPAELDLMARLAGLERVERFADWERAPFTAGAHRHVTLYRKAAGSA
ncbi:class I SAM-dependent methyltransferase [Saccharomonospora halophila]|uniref:class I SAM-dependent methyltransferase n=1 Tax=Saccharomonospora halophila TaxID=129922 RepID=UPI000367794E|nr:class I SAM-dependent methyltransferase [Saccharomonospora halophila]